MAIFVKRLGSVLPEFELVFFRSVLNLFFVVILMLIHGEKFLPDVLHPKKAERKTVFRLHLLLIFRGLVGFGGVSCLFYSIHHLPLPIAMLLGWTSPLFVMLFSRIFIGEKLAKAAWIAVLLAFFGLLLLLNPHQGGAGVDSKGIPLHAIFIGITGAAMSGAAYVAVRAATARVGVNLIVVYFMIVSTSVSAPLAARDFQFPSWDQGWALLVIGISAAIGQVTMTHGYRYAPASRVSTMSLLNAAFSAFFGWWLFNERLTPIQWGGMAILASGIASLTWGERSRAQAETLLVQQGASRVKLGYE